nr:MAG: ORF1 [TTV-like mini virus]
MPAFWRNYWRNRRYQRRRRRPFRWRARRTFRTRRYRRRPTVRKRHFKRKLPKRKLKKLKLYQWQPSSIRLCHIKGQKCLFMGGLDRLANNYAQYQQTFVPEHEPGGGCWSLMVFSLEALWEEHLLVRNYWTHGNNGLPLVRYIKSKFKFYREQDTDYIVSYSLCYPMTDTPLTHANSQPYNMTISRKRFIVPSLQTKPRGKPYIRKTFRPPTQMKNKWYFQSEICKTGLLLLTTVATDLKHFYANPWAISNNITLHCLNPTIFKHNGFIETETQGYTPKAGSYYYCLKGTEHTPKVKDLHYLGRTGPQTLGYSYNEKSTNYTSNKENWGNIFHPDVLKLNIPVFLSTQQMIQVFSQANLDKQINLKTGVEGLLTLVENPFIIPVRYNPDRDTGQDNITWLNSIVRNTGSGFEVPQDNNIKISGFPLWLQWWGWPDWQKKLAYLHSIDSSYIMVTKTKFTEPKLDYLIPIDMSFLNGNGPYNLPQEELSVYTFNSWWPKLAHQLVSIDELCQAGPGTGKFTGKKQLQAHCSYDFQFKWGGCPAPMTELLNPCLQPKYPVPDNLLQRLQIQNPKTAPQTELHQFDQRGDYLTETCLQRIREYTETNQNLSTITESAICPPTKTQRQILQEALQQTSDTETEEKETPKLLQQYKHQQQLLKRAILRLIRRSDIE